jgi:SAM-dependent methyltransferase
MTDLAERKQQLANAAKQAGVLQAAYVGIVNGLFGALDALETATPAQLADKAGVDAGYVTRWCDAAYAFELLDEEGGEFRLTPLGAAFDPDAPDTLMPMAVGSILGAHMTERAAGLMESGERPGEKVLGERETVLPWFGPMLEKRFGPFFREQLVPNVPVFARLNETGGTVADLGCGNGWYLRALASRCDGIRGIGVDGFAENVEQAARLAETEGLGDRLSFETGDIYDFAPDEPVDAIAMNRAMHHVWSDRDKVFEILSKTLAPGGSAIIWEPNWPAEREALRDERRRGLALQNLSEHVQGNHLLRPEEIEAAFEEVGMEAETYLFADGAEAVIVGTKPSS